MIQLRRSMYVLYMIAFPLTIDTCTCMPTYFTILLGGFWWVFVFPGICLYSVDNTLLNEGKTHFVHQDCRHTHIIPLHVRTYCANTEHTYCANTVFMNKMELDALKGTLTSYMFVYLHAHVWTAMPLHSGACVMCTSCWFQGFGREGRLRSTQTILRTSSSVGSLGRRSKYGNWASSAWPEKDRILHLLM